MTIGEALDMAAERLRASRSASPRRDAEVLLGAVLERGRAFLIAHPLEALSDRDAARFEDWVRRRAAGEPPQYLTGRQEFYGREFLVDPRVLIPRPETEILVEWALEILAGMAHPRPRVLDWGTGSGCIGLTLLAESPRIRLTALDASVSALEAARRNAVRLGCAERVDWLASDSLSALRPAAAFDLIVANPPYIGAVEWPGLDPQVRRHEPARALLAGETGLEALERLLTESRGQLRRQGSLLAEFGQGQGPPLRKMASELGWSRVDSRPDLAGIERCALFRQSAHA